MASLFQQNLANYYYAVLPIPAAQTFRPGRNSNDDDLTAGALVTTAVDTTGTAVGTVANPLITQGSGVGSGTAGTATTTSVAASATNVVAHAANLNRRGMTFTNSGTAGNIFLTYGAASTTATYTVKLVPGAFFNMPAPIYTGAIDAIWDTTTSAGPLLITELTP